MTGLEEVVVDSSVLMTFFRRDGGDLQPAADRLLDAVAAGESSLLLLDLAVYEFANVLVRRHGADGDVAAARVVDLLELADVVVRVNAELAGRAAVIAAATGLSAYDAAFIAAAEAMAAPLITTDERVVGAATAATHLREYAAPTE